jgi:hypothetical protein
MALLLRFGALALLTGLVFAAQHQAVFAKSTWEARLIEHCR